MFTESRKRQIFQATLLSRVTRQRGAIQARYVVQLARSVILPICLTRLGCARMGQVRAVPPTFTWSSEEPTIKVVQFLCWGSSSEKSPTLTVECRRFVPATGDKIDLEWRTGDEVTIVKMPPYAIVSSF